MLWKNARRKFLQHCRTSSVTRCNMNLARTKNSPIMEKFCRTSSVTWCYIICPGGKCTQKIFTAVQNEFSNSMQNMQKHEPCLKNRQNMQKICKTSSVTWCYFICPGGKMHAESFYSIAERRIVQLSSVTRCNMNLARRIVQLWRNFAEQVQ